MNATFYPPYLSNPDNYRKVTIMNSTCKLFEIILNNRFKFKNDMLCQDDPLQIGFVENGRTADNVFILYTALNITRAQKDSLYCCFIDFTKAFDYINRHAMFYKLIMSGVKGKSLKILIDMFNKSSMVRVNAALSERIDSSYGVLQGGVLSPKLFNSYLCDLGEHLDKSIGVNIHGTKVAHLLYADDLVLLATTAEGLQSQLQNLYNYCKKWHLIVSMTKTNVMIFNAKKKQKSSTFSYNNEVVEVVESYKYLGFLICSNHKDIFHDVYQQLASKGRKTSYQAYTCCQYHVGRPCPRLALKLFDSQIRPSMDYGCEIWGTNNTKGMRDMEPIHLKFLKAMLGVRKQTTSAAVYADTGRVPLRIHWEVQTLKYWERILDLPDTHILHKCYLQLLSLDNSGQVNWYSNVKNLLCSISERYQRSWDTQDTSSDSKAIASSSRILHQLYIDNLMSDIQTSGEGKKLRTYKLFKTEFHLEHYLLDVTNPFHRVALAQYRLSSHNLGIETGRHTKPPKPQEQRLCLYCRNGSVDDEIHFLTECDIHTETRQRFVSNIKSHIDGYGDLPASGKFVTVMTSSSEVVIKELAKFVYNAFQQRLHHV